MMAAAQPFISGAISKTVNKYAKRGITVQDIEDCYFESAKIGLSQTLKLLHKNIIEMDLKLLSTTFSIFR